MRKKTIVALVMGTVLVANMFLGMKTEKVLAAETNFCGAGEFISTSETLSYARKETSEYSIKGDLPNYTASLGNTACANIAGAVLIGYYDRFNENLIPNYKTYNKVGTLIKYKLFGAEVSAVMSELYSLMGTDSNKGGTTFSGFQKGMKSYAEAHSSSYISEDIGNSNFEKVKSSVTSDVPVAVFLLSYAFLTNLNTSNNLDVVKSVKSTEAHVVIACGYKIDTYYGVNGDVIAQRCYLKVASGLDDYGIIYLCLDGKSDVDRFVTVKLS
ncbi:MAG: hypothetical protein K2L02_02230 [Clostridia bacterium]|nr:hypothetical protein [Clostridia bacterium]